jgi:Tfp pilus assembly protein PilW
MKKDKRLGISGQSLFEIMFAITISAIVLVGILSVAAFSLRNATFARNKAMANDYSREIGEWLKQQKNIASSWQNFYALALPSSPTTWCFVDLSWISPSHTGVCTNSEYITGTTIFQRQTVASDQDSGNGLKFTTTVSWTDSTGLHSSQTTTVLTNW